MIDARRFEVPSRYRHLRDLTVRYASWDLSQVHLIDERSGHVLCRLYPQDKQRNASGLRAPLEPLVSGAVKMGESPADAAPVRTVAPLLEKLLTQQTATGLQPAYLPKDEQPPAEDEDP